MFYLRGGLSPGRIGSTLYGSSTGACSLRLAASELTDPEIDHVGIGTGDTGEQEYVVSLTADDGDGSVIFSPDLRVLEISVYR